MPISYIAPILLLAISNVFMTFAWYYHLKIPHLAIWTAILFAWGIAFIEYCFAVPANRIGHKVYSLAELKTIQEVLTLVIFAGFAVLVFGEKLTVFHGIGFALIAIGAGFVFTASRGVLGS
jgi:uncharacterized protein (DUF486 family)